MKKVYQVRVTNGINKGFKIFAETRKQVNKIKAQLKLSGRTIVYCKIIDDPRVPCEEFVDAQLA